jgi:hypothetical protein
VQSFCHRKRTWISGTTCRGSNRRLHKEARISDMLQVISFLFAFSEELFVTIEKRVRELPLSFFVLIINHITVRELIAVVDSESGSVDYCLMQLKHMLTECCFIAFCLASRKTSLENMKSCWAAGWRSDTSITEKTTLCEGLLLVQNLLFAAFPLVQVHDLCANSSLIALRPASTHCHNTPQPQTQ